MTGFSSKLKPVVISGKEVLPIVEGGKGIGATNGVSAGAFAAAGAVGTFSGVNADRYDEQGNIIEQEYKSTTRRERHEELVAFGIEGAVQQAKIAHEKASGQGRIHMNILWEMGGAERILEGTLERTKGLIHGVTCGAGMPYRRHRRALWCLLPPHCVIHARLPCALEAGLSQNIQMAGQRGL